MSDRGSQPLKKGSGRRSRPETVRTGLLVRKTCRIVDVGQSSVAELSGRSCETRFSYVPLARRLSEAEPEPPEPDDDKARAPYEARENCR
jgi:hypothetical protein